MSLGRERVGKKPVSLAPEDSSNSLLGLHITLPRRQSREEQEPQLDGQSRPQEDQSGGREIAEQVTGPQPCAGGGCEQRPLAKGLRWTTLLPGPPECLGAEGRLARKLFRDLFTNYTNALRPVADTDQALNVTLEVTLSQIIDMVCCGGSVEEWGGGGGNERLGLFSKHFYKC